MEEITASPKPPTEILQPVKQQQPQLAQPKPQTVLNKPESAVKISVPQKQIPPKSASSMKIESEQFDIKSESEHHLENTSSKMKSMFEANGLGDLGTANLMKGGINKPGMMNEAFFQAFRHQQNVDNLKVNKTNLPIPGNTTQSGAGLPFGANHLQSNNDSHLDMISGLPEHVKNQLMMNILYQNSGKNLSNKNLSLLSQKGVPFTHQQSHTQSQLPPQLGAQFLQQHPQFQLQHLVHAQNQLQVQDIAKDQQLLSNE